MQPLPSPKGETKAGSGFPFRGRKGSTGFAFSSIFVLIVIAPLLFSSCKTGNHENQPAKKQCIKTSSLPVKYAKGFAIDYYDGFKVLTVKDLKDSSKVLAQFVLQRPSKAIPIGFENATSVIIPVRKTVCISATTIGEMAILNLLDSIAAVTDVDYIYNPTVIEKLKHNQIADVGKQEVNYEKLVELHPAFVFTSGGFDGGDKLELKLSSLHIISVPDLEYKEQDPLGRAEWIKFIGAFYNREAEADSIFHAIEKHYTELKALAAKAEKRPTVFFNLPFKEIWYMPCGENYMALLIEDAGGNFLWKDASATNGLNLSLDYEAVYNKAANADFWINTGFAASLKDIQSADKKNTLFKAFKTGNIYNNNKRNTTGGGFDFWESGPVKPDEVLADLITIFHPELLKGHELYFYQKLK